MLLIALLAIVGAVFASVGVIAERGTGPTAGLGQSLVTFPGAYNQILSFVLGLGGLFAVIYGAAVAGSEWPWGTLKLTVTRGQRRATYLLLSFVAVAVLLAAGVVLVTIVGIAGAYIGATVGNVPTSGISDLTRWQRCRRRSSAAGSPSRRRRPSVSRSRPSPGASSAGIGVGIALYFGGTFLALFLPNVVKWLPFNAASAVVAGGTSGFGGAGLTVQQLEPDTALIVVIVWLIASMAITSVYVSAPRSRADRRRGLRHAVAELHGPS